VLGRLGRSGGGSAAPLFANFRGRRSAEFEQVGAGIDERGIRGSRGREAVFCGLRLIVLRRHPGESFLFSS